MNKIAFVFPGQGSQSTGMGKSLYESSPKAKKVFDKADEVLGRSISKICFEGPEEDLKQTINTQPAILVTSIAALEALKEKCNVKPDFVAGHSLGEYGALYAAGVIDFNSAMNLIQKRAELMNDAAQNTKGTMAAVLGMSQEDILEVLSKIEGQVSVANYNCPGQIVITGEVDAVAKAGEMLSAAGAKRVMPLAVSGGFHSPLMKDAGEKFGEYVDSHKINDAVVPVITNVDASLTISSDEFKAKMSQQVYSSVLWTQTIEEMTKNGVDTVIEIGPGRVLAGLCKKINPELKIFNIFDTASLNKVVEELNACNV